MIVKFENLALEVRPDEAHEWLIETAIVANGYDVSTDAIYAHFKRNAEELHENKHYIRIRQNVGFAEKEVLFWTKRGVIRLGFFIKSERAKKFRDWAEDLIIKQELRPMTALEIMVMSAQQLLEHERQLIALETVQEQIQKDIFDLKVKTNTRPSYFTVVGYATLIGVKVNLSLAAEIGRKAAKACYYQNYPIDKVNDPRFGSVGSYPEEVLSEIFKSI